MEQYSVNTVDDDSCEGVLWWQQVRKFGELAQWCIVNPPTTANKPFIV